MRIPIVVISSVFMTVPVAQNVCQDVHEQLQPNQFRINFHPLVDVYGSYVERVTFETLEDAEVSVGIGAITDAVGKGFVVCTKKESGQKLATKNIVILLDYFSKGEEQQKALINRSFLRFNLTELRPNGDLDGGVDNWDLLKVPDAKLLTDIMKKKMKPGIYNYTHNDLRDKPHVLSTIGDNCILIRVTDRAQKK